MTENKKKLKLPENIKIKDDESGEVLELEKERFIIGSSIGSSYIDAFN